MHTHHRLPVAVGLVLAIVTIGTHLLLDREASIAIAAILLGGIGGAYVGFAVMDGRPEALLFESVGAMLFFAIAIAGVLWVPWAIIGGLAGHAAWDTFHYRRGPWTNLRPWYIPFCAVYDLLAAVGLGLLWYGPFQS